ncbi:hypothetical protein [Streptomyces olivochromogenes]|uniref:hypothetical protein n=1 Tax=Streptomyces olivochromogenes TaxID=1963 RepID=UPI0036978157
MDKHLDLGLTVPRPPLVDPLPQRGQNGAAPWPSSPGPCSSPMVSAVPARQPPTAGDRAGKAVLVVTREGKGDTAAILTWSSSAASVHRFWRS